MKKYQNPSDPNITKDELIRDMYYAIQDYLEDDTKTTADLWTITQCFERHSKCSNECIFQVRAWKKIKEEKND